MAKLHAIGSGISVWPGSEVYTNGFFLGSDGAGSQLQQAMGVFDDLETYDSPIDAATMGGIYNFHTISYTNVPPVFIAPEGATFTFQASPTLDAVTGQGNLQLAGVTNSTGCIENNSVWLTNVIASVVNSNQTVNFTFSIAGGADGVLYDVFANSVPSMGNSTVPWVWEGQGYHCNTYMLTNFPLGTVFCVLGSTTIDSDNDGLPDAFEKLIGSNPNSPSTASDGLSDLYKYQHGLPFGSMVTAVPSLGSLSVPAMRCPLTSIFTHMKPFLQFVLGLLLTIEPLGASAQTVRAGANGGINASERRGVSDLPGQLDFHTDLYSGRFGYQVPFDVAPGRHDSQPSLGMVYSSANPNGSCGVGWDLDLGYIQRQTRYGVPVQWTNGLPVAAYDDGKSFVFSLNSQMSSLVPFTNNEYRAEIQGNFLRFFLQTNVNQWLVIDKSGNQYVFGTNSASRMSNSKTGWPSNSWNGTYRWALSHVQDGPRRHDRLHLHQFQRLIVSIEAQLLMVTLAELATNSATVDFLLESRSDVTLSFISGYRVEQNRRLAALVHKVAGQIVWSNKLVYSQSPSTGRSLLKSVTRYGTNLTSSLPPLNWRLQHSEFWIPAFDLLEQCLHSSGWLRCSESRLFLGDGSDRQRSGLRGFAGYGWR